MSLAPALLTGVALAKSHSTSQNSITNYADVEALRGRKERVEPRPSRQSPDPAAGDDAKWPAWKVTLFVLVFCGTFWGGVIWLVMRLLG